MVSHIIGSEALILTYSVTGEWESSFGALQSYHIQAGRARFGLHPDFPRNARLKCSVDAASGTQSQTGKCFTNFATALPGALYVSADISDIRSNGLTRTRNEASGLVVRLHRRSIECLYRGPSAPADRGHV